MSNSLLLTLFSIEIFELRYQNVTNLCTYMEK